MGQLITMSPDASDEHQECFSCHAPLKVLADSLVTSLTLRHRPTEEIGSALHERGLVCAASHVRGYKLYDPPRNDGSKLEPETKLPRSGWVSEPTFGDSRFCAACHQFTNDGYALNSKLLENTYEEWKASRYALESRTCQPCHMPDRRHHGAGYMSSTGKYPPIRVGKSPNTRVAPDQQALFDYRIPLHRGAASLVFRVQVKPDPFNTNFYRDPLKKQTDRLRGAIDPAGPEKSLASAFALYSHHGSLSVSVTCPLLHRYKVSAVCKD